jgi:hypothetical protein
MIYTIGQTSKSFNRWIDTFSVKHRGGHAQLFFESAITIPQLFKECCSATATPQFRNRNFF